MDIKKLVKLDRGHIEKIQALTPTKVFQTTANLFYEGQTPIVAFLVIDGCINLSKNRRLKTSLRTGALVGLKELMSNSPAGLTAEVIPNTSLCLLDRSTILEILNDKESDLSLLFYNLCDKKAS
jgi:CRP-like cAMP-binding protein